jgi:hypothetical protein
MGLRDLEGALSAAREKLKSSARLLTEGEGDGEGEDGKRGEDGTEDEKKEEEEEEEREAKGRVRAGWGVRCPTGRWSLSISFAVALVDQSPIDRVSQSYLAYSPPRPEPRMLAPHLSLLQSMAFSNSRLDRGRMRKGVVDVRIGPRDGTWSNRVGREWCTVVVAVVPNTVRAKPLGVCAGPKKRERASGAMMGR